MEQQNVVITGVGQGIGRAILEAYVKENYTVIGVDHDEDLLADLNRRENVHTYKVDISEPEEVHSFFNSVARAHKRIDVLINNAGIGRWVPPTELSVKDWDIVVNTNLRGSFLCAREAAKRMSHGGRIVNISSTRASMSEPNSEAYAASKAGLLGLTHSLAASLAAKKITVNAISPGWIETGDYAKLRDVDHLQHFSGRVGMPEDIARACLFLTDPANQFITGENIVIDGGMTRKMIYEH
ncbi:SDR family NAD(P)-dependent oxidoreductase [Aureibacillus halotolerans]|uniref:NAD(P)-dependent dehydrogenase (Short-subunit alcohol dehydrogenase family) n=1 Tax=Aureibacillus halotolerans TaxID=1508390 RepID=A0A4R6TVY4_9BACI|nr:SDR family oxidoreductase [Aureibacillus halotolerans]TDQ37396.1 hypothetical protein EV213_11330 [Aureibacillus halotolerans]